MRSTSPLRSGSEQLLTVDKRMADAAAVLGVDVVAG
jgi:hypothetical protein